jgi:hypothetical protein
MPLQARLAYYRSAQFATSTTGGNFTMKQDPKCNPEQWVTQASGREENPASAQTPTSPARRKFLRASLIGGAAAAAVTAVKPMSTDALERSFLSRPDEIAAFEFDDITIADLQDAMKSGKHTARSVAEKYLARIDQIDKQGPAINSIIELNPENDDHGGLARAPGLQAVERFHSRSKTSRGRRRHFGKNKPQRMG